jgi:hypothetical protein
VGSQVPLKSRPPPRRRTHSRWHRRATGGAAAGGDQHMLQQALFAPPSSSSESWWSLRVCVRAREGWERVRHRRRSATRGRGAPPTAGRGAAPAAAAQPAAPGLVLDNGREVSPVEVLPRKHLFLILLACCAAAAAPGAGVRRRRRHLRRALHQADGHDLRLRRRHGCRQAPARRAGRAAGPATRKKKVACGDSSLTTRFGAARAAGIGSAGRLLAPLLLLRALPGRSTAAGAGRTGRRSRKISGKSVRRLESAVQGAAARRSKADGLCRRVVRPPALRQTECGR